MKHILQNFKGVIFLILLIFSAVVSYGQAGFNTTYIVLDNNNSGNVYYDLQASTANPDFDNSNLGVHCEGSATLIFKGAEHNNYKCGGCDITATQLMYRIYPTGSPSGGFIINSIGYSSGFSNGCGGEDQQWSSLAYNTNLLNGLSAGNYTIEVYSEQSTTCLGTVYASNGGNNFKATFTVNANVTYYLDADNDGFGTNSVSQVSCTGAPIGYVTNNLDCNDNQLQYLDTDGDGYGSPTLVGCGVTNNSDCNDNQIQYLDGDGDGFGANIAVACGVLNNGDCNDNQLQYYDADGDGFGSSTLIGCGVANNSDCNDNQIQYLDADGDGFGANIAVACGVFNNGDCNDNQLQYYDADGDGFGSSTLVGCGVFNNSDCNDNQIQYLDADGDGFGANIAVACGVFNNGDCNDNQLQYYDADGDGFGSSTLVGCGVFNNSDCNDNQIQYLDADGDGFGANIPIACGVTNNGDCNDNQLQYYDADGDGFGSMTLVGCGVFNNSDCNDNQIQYLDADGDGFGANIAVACGVTNNGDCNDNQLQYYDADGDGFGSMTLVGCGVFNNSDCNDNQIQFLDADGDGFGANIPVACGVTNNGDCNDNQLQYLDADGDGFGSMTLVGCGVFNNIDSNDNLLTYVDNDNDGFGQNVFAPSGPTNNFDCNDNQLQYQDADGDGFGHPTILVACGLANNIDSNDNLITYVDNDNDGFGQNVFAPSGPINNFDCNDNQLQYQDADGDGFGHPTILVACGLANNIDSNDNLITYVDNDNDGFGQNVFAPSGPTNNFDCNDNQLQYLDADGDGLGSTTLVACGVTNNSDCNDNDFLNLTGITYYQDADGDGYGNPSMTTSACVAPVGYVLDNSDCNDANASVHPGAIDVCYDGIDNDCNGIIDNACTPIISVVQGAQCGSVLSSINQSIYANLVAGAQGYRFRVTDMTTNQVQTIDRILRVFQLTQLTNYAFNRTYQIEVSIRYNNVWQPFYGLPCTVTTPSATTQIQAAQCGGALITMNDIIYANNVPFATGYKFRITNLLTSAQVEVERPLREIKMTQTSIAEYNTTYSVEVAVKNTNGVYLPYGTPCNISTPSFPTTQLQLSQCDVAIANNNTTIYADSYAGATTYRFKFTNTNLGYTYQFDRLLRSFVLNTVPGLVSGETYSVQVSVEINGVFGPFGKVCTITTPGSTKVNADHSKPAIEFQVTAAPNPFGDYFSLNVTSSSEEMIQIKIYDLLGKLIEQKSISVQNVEELQLGTDLPSGVYNVIAAQGDEVQSLRLIKR
jgi:Putative metal-binding motif/Secretion system C-terminal sorting domain